MINFTNDNNLLLFDATKFKVTTINGIQDRQVRQAGHRVKLNVKAGLSRRSKRHSN